MPNGTYGGVRGKETKIGRKTFVSLPTQLGAVCFSMWVCRGIVYSRRVILT